MGQDTAMDEDTSIKDELAMDEAVPKDMPTLVMGRRRAN
jgi:hypothetical protein